MLVRKLRIYAILMRLQELQNEKHFKALIPEPIKFEPQPFLPIVKELFDKKGKPFEQPKSKYHK
ncbi:hypothetical protein [Flavobacterium commune]|uniref:Uncharacterized protein n=1 Tax=Flavobacterium commune TaxID=1306519 RepID=A0A1D9PB80_9FLAO|nr:hypothetical protein [Flavobacterium commune]AOZ99584.1 hypothetical protein BIW12_09105 [Flavobacterium commune]